MNHPQSFKGACIVRVALPVPLRRLFDYRCAGEPPAPGARVRVPFGSGQRVGLAVEVTNSTALAPAQLKSIIAILDESSLLDAELLATARWAANYWQGSLGDALFSALPAALRDGRSLPGRRVDGWQISSAGSTALNQGRAPRGATTALLTALAAGSLQADTARALPPAQRAALNRLRNLGWIEPLAEASTIDLAAHGGPPLTRAQQSALGMLLGQSNHFAVTLLEGVTGSGKTEVYLGRMREVLSRNRQVLMLVPEIGLVAQAAQRIQERLGVRVDILHSGLSDGLRLEAWLRARDGTARVLLGTRSAIFTPLPRGGLIVIDEEHDASYKQQDGFRYHARDLALKRAQAIDIPVLLGSATPSLESLHNVDRGRYAHVRLAERANARPPPRVELIDLRRIPARQGLSSPLIEALADTFAHGEQALVFRNRRGYAPVLTCAQCGWHADCPHCQRPLTWHRAVGRLECHLCARLEPAPSACPSCGSGALQPQGHGTERLEEALAERFPSVPLLRVDRETTRTRAAQSTLDVRLPNYGPALLVGTQMLAKGHDLPRLTLVAITSVDEGLYSVDFRAPERLAQLVVQVAGRAGRGERPGRVLLQTRHPDHPLLSRLLAGGYGALARELMEERRAAQLPPFAHHVLLRAESIREPSLFAFLDAARALLPSDTRITMAGPMPSPLPKRGLKWRGQLLLAASERGALHRMLSPWVQALEALPQARGVHWSVDVDPLDVN